jgi:hypothetical protein
LRNGGAIGGELKVHVHDVVLKVLQDLLGAELVARVHVDQLHGELRGGDGD